ncbi:MAG: ribosome silencing factor [Betaproteobacteria bacterium]|nr:ribosome silencing factor [Betaproteobacteria bacterium]
MRLDKLVKTTVDALEDIKGRDIVVLDVRRITALFDKVIVVSGDSVRQNKALANNVQEKAKALGATVHGVEGTDSGEWVLVDLGSIVVHIMQPAIRLHYNLEELWGAAAVVPGKRAAGRAR